MNLGIVKKNLEPSVGTEDLVAAKEEFTSACESLSELGFECAETSKIVANLTFCIDKINKADDPNAMVDALDIASSCEGLFEIASDKLKAQSAVAGMEGLLSDAWEKIKAFFAKLAELAKKVVGAIVSGVEAKQMEKDGSDLEVIPDGVGSVKLDEPLAGVPTEKSFQEREKAFEARLSEMKDENKKLLDAFNKATAKTAESEKNLAEMQKILEASAKKDDNYAKVVEKIDELAKNTKAYSLEEAGWGDLKIKDIGKKLKYIWNRGPLANDIKMLQQQITDAQNQVNKIKLEADTPYRAAIISHTNQYIAKLRKDLQTCINHNRWHKHLFAVLKTAVKKGLKKLWSGTKSGIKAAPGKISEATKNAWGKYLSIRGTGPKVGGIPIY